MGITEEEGERIQNFFCDECEKTGALSTWLRTAIKPRFEKDSMYFEVEAIRKHRIQRDERFFLVEWKNSPVEGTIRNARTWEPEEFLDGSIDLLQSYLRRHKLPLSHILQLKIIKSNRRV